MTASTSLNNAQPARDIGYGVVQAIVKTIAFNTLGIGTADTVKVGTVPAGAQLLQAVIRVTEAFNAATTNVIIIGTAAGSDADITGASDVTEGSTGTAIVLTGAGLAFTADTPIYVKYTQTGTAATTGSAVIVITFVATGNG